jgi:uncharacterized RDD family membrane protein YckC
MDNNWYYSETGEQSHGPVSIEDLGHVLSTNHGSENFFVWSPGMSDWARAGSVANLKRHFQQHTPPPLRAPPSDALATATVGNAISSKLHPWRRYFARMIDLYIFILVFFFFLGIAFPELFAADRTSERQNEYLYAFIGVAAYSIFETFCLNVFGTTFGKLIYGIRLASKVDDQIAFAVALKRSLAVWARGMGLGIPIVTLVTLIVAYRTLLKDGQTTWDRDFNLVVRHRELSVLRWVGVAVAWLLLLSIYAVLIGASKS